METAGILFLAGTTPEPRSCLHRAGAVVARDRRCSNPAFVGGNTSAPQLIFADHIGVNDRTQGGLINGNTAGGTGSTLAANALKGLMLTGPTDAVSSFNYGSTYNGSICYKRLQQ